MKSTEVAVNGLCYIARLYLIDKTVKCRVYMLIDSFKNGHQGLTAPKGPQGIGEAWSQLMELVESDP